MGAPSYTTDAPVHPRYTQRTCEWGHWGITFLDVQPDRTMNFGRIVGTLGFPIGHCGPADMPRREEYRQMITDWISTGTLPRDEILWIGV